MKDKYKMFKNFLYNELDISKSDIEFWIKESCEDIARRMIANEFGKFDLKAVIRSEMSESELFSDARLKGRIVNKTAEILAERLTLTLDGD